MPMVKSFFLHQWVNHRQALCYKDLKRLLPRLPEGHVILISDFAMNASPLLENKEAFFAKGQITLNSNGNSSNSPEHFVLPKAWTDQVLAEIKKDEDTIPHDLLLWEAM